MILWSSIMMNILDVDLESRNKMLYATNTWSDIYSKNEFNKYLWKHGSLYELMFRLLNPTDKSSTNKIKYWNEIRSNSFTGSSVINEMEDIFYRTQKYHQTIGRFFLRCRLKYAKPKIQMDLEMNDIQLKSGLSMSIYQDGYFYYFTLRDLINICNSSLLYAESFFNEPYLPKNPYTNNEFPKGVLMNIYHEIRYSNYEMPILLQLLYKEFFNMDKFLEKNEYILREEVIKDFSKNAPITDKMDEISDMLHMKCLSRKFVFDEDFPEKKILEAFDGVLYFYLLSEYSMRSHSKRMFYRTLVQYKLLQFSNANSQFGRKIFKSIKEHEFGTNATKIRWKTEFIDHYQSINIAKFPTMTGMIRYITLHKSDYESDYDSDDITETDENEDTNHVSHHIEISSNDDAVIYPYTPQQIVFNSDDEENRELEEGEISEKDDENSE